ncbi:MAG: GAF domain-containing protein [Geobacteraceae bacterium]|nr:GAF domain-containing protein [Geobacteraceae bacterium]
MNYEQFALNFNRTIVDAVSPLEIVEAVAASLGEAFTVGRDEVAIFSFDKVREVLVFIWPHSLKSIGSIPLNAHRCLVSKTAMEKSGSLDNSFASTPHLYMFEHFLTDKEKRVPIQKIMSVPIMGGSNLKGVVQVARKGLDRDSSGADFSAADLELLTYAAMTVADYL